MNPEHERVAVVVVTFNSGPLIADLVASLDAGMGGVEWQLVVADNASTDGSVATVRRLVPAATVVQLGRNAGYAAGINAGVRAAGTHTAILALNPDVRLGAGCVPELLRAIREPGVGIAVPRLVDAKGNLIHSMRREPTVLRGFGDALLGAVRAGRWARLGEMVTDPREYQSEKCTDWAEGSTQLISAECWERCGSWDESFFLYSEETDFDLRARDAGYRARFVPTASATHLEGGSTDSPLLWRLLVLNRVRLFQRRNGLVRTSLFWLTMVLREATRALLGKRTSRAAVKALLNPRRLGQRPDARAVE